MLALKRRKTLAEGIADILQKDLEVLIISLVKYRERASILRTQLYDVLLRSYSQFIEAEMVSGSLKVKELAVTTTPKDFKVETSSSTGVLGIQFPSLKLIKQEVSEHKPRLSLFDAPIQLEEAASKINDVMDAIVELASLLAAIRELLEVISLKRRQINRIRFKIVPQLDSTIDYIEYILEEIEQQDAIRVRVLQRKRKERSEKSDETSSL
ncbi:MAG: V-type ATP synthase subunit D [Gammaproteobacteria bacterium]|jgi:H(+)-transporting ATP synthase subunit D|nr:V-type ATP synthase subunit D [Gammaproteobacteria bacterium]